MTDQARQAAEPVDYGKIQLREAQEALAKMEPWRLAEIRRDLNIPAPEKSKP